MSAVAINSRDHGPVVIPFVSIKLVRRANNGTAIIAMHTGEWMVTHDRFEDVSARMTAATEPA